MAVRGPTWDPTELSRTADAGWLGWLVVSGVLIRMVDVGGRTACEVLGPGDLIRPWDADGEYEPIVVGLRWRVPGSAELALLDGSFAARISPWPRITAELVSRVARRARALTFNQAASHLSHADDRLLITFSVLGERWGRMNHEGIVITLPLTHETLAMMIGVRRPTATIAVKRLTDAGLLERRGAAHWLLTKRAVDRLMQPDGFQHRADGAVCPTAYLTGGALYANHVHDDGRVSQPTQLRPTPTFTSVR